METIRAKFICNEVTKRKHWDNTMGYLYDAKFHPVSCGSEENKRFYAATPSGQISLTSILPDAFEPGKEYYVDFIEAV